ncbi:hypothetical protein WR25_14820 [Diploscapter pachys]|uniref:Uncharacterized protein n=1 Tax=Diploscapter pachys TaxID=2018661 RepID=A0A2A2JYZ3_9BILA|nr:hypothetical protein WR25_14820 [Diploscapter pachys]
MPGRGDPARYRERPGTVAGAQHDLLRAMAQRHAQAGPDAARRGRDEGCRGQVRQILLARAGCRRLRLRDSSGLSEAKRLNRAGNFVASVLNGSTTGRMSHARSGDTRTNHPRRSCPAVFRHGPFTRAMRP